MTGALRISPMLLAFASPALAEPTVPAWTPVVSARAGLGILGQEAHAPGLCCGERDSWNSFGPALALRGGYLFGSRFLASAEVAYGFHRHEGRDEALTLHMPALALDATVIIVDTYPRVSASLGAGLIRYAGNVQRNLAALPEETIAEWKQELHIRGAVEFPIAPQTTAGVELSLTKVMIAEHVIGLTAMLSYWPLAR